MEGVVIFVSTAYGDPNPTCPQPPKIVQPMIQGLTYSSFSQKPETAVRTVAHLMGDASAAINGVELIDIDLPACWYGYDSCEFVHGVAIHVVPPPCAALSNQTRIRT